MSANLVARINVVTNTAAGVAALMRAIREDVETLLDEVEALEVVPAEVTTALAALLMQFGLDSDDQLDGEALSG